MKRVVITGIGAVTPLGTGKKALWAGVLSGQSAVKPITRFDASPLKSRIAAAIDDFIPEEHQFAKALTMVITDRQYKEESKLNRNKLLEKFNISHVAAAYLK